MKLPKLQKMLDRHTLATPTSSMEIMLTPKSVIELANDISCGTAEEDQALEALQESIILADKVVVGLQKQYRTLTGRDYTWFK